MGGAVDAALALSMLIIPLLIIVLTGSVAIIRHVAELDEAGARVALAAQAGPGVVTIEVVGTGVAGHHEASREGLALALGVIS